MAVADDAFCLPDDVLVQILLLLTPASSRRPLRLVCKGWRDLIDERAPPPPHEKLPTKILVFINRGRSATALVFDGKSSRHRHKWTYTSSSEDEGSSIHMVGTCNGLLCLHDHTSYGGVSFSAVTVTNPLTGDTAALPPVPTRWAWSQFVKAPGKYSFGFHPETKRHKVVYIPRGQYRSADNALQVFTLGGGGGAAAAWRAVPVRTPGACYDLLCEPVTAGGCTYWVAASSGEVMALDLKDERVTSFAVTPAMGPVPAMSAPRYWRKYNKWRLTKVVGAKIGVVVSSPVEGAFFETRVEVWVLDGGGGSGGEKPPRWSRRYSVVEGLSWRSSWVMAPQLTHGDWVLRASEEGRLDGDYPYWCRFRKRLYRHEVGDLTDGKIERRRPPKEAELIISEEERKLECKQLTTFAYVETLNPVPRIK